MVYALGLGDQLCGVTHECDYPPEARGKPVAIRSLIDSSHMGQREIDEMVVESMSHGHGLSTISHLSKRWKVVSLKPGGLEGVLEDVLTVGKACDAESAAEELVRS